MSGYAYQMNAALEKIQRLQAEVARERQQHEALILENHSLRLAAEDMKRLREENTKLKGQLQDFLDRMEKATKWR